MAVDAPSFSEGSWIGAFVLVAGAVGSILGLAFVFNQDRLILLAIGAGFGWATMAALFVVNAMLRSRNRALETELVAARRQADAWASASASASAASKAVAELFRPQISTPSPRRTKKKENEE